MLLLAFNLCSSLFLSWVWVDVFFFCLFVWLLRCSQNLWLFIFLLWIYEQCWCRLWFEYLLQVHIWEWWLIWPVCGFPLCVMYFFFIPKICIVLDVHWIWSHNAHAMHHWLRSAVVLSGVLCCSTVEKFCLLYVGIEVKQLSPWWFYISNYSPWDA